MGYPANRSLAGPEGTPVQHIPWFAEPRAQASGWSGNGAALFFQKTLRIMWGQSFRSAAGLPPGVSGSAEMSLMRAASSTER